MIIKLEERKKIVIKNDKIKNLIVKANDNMEEEIRNKFDEFLKIFFDKISFVKNKITQIKKILQQKQLKIV